MQGVFQINRFNPTVAKLELTLHKPNGEQVGVLNDAINRNGDFSYGQFNTLEFSVPRFVERKHNLVKYVEFDLLRDKYLIKATYGDLFSEYLVITNIKKTGGQTPQKHVKAKSRQHELNGFILTNLEALSYTVRELLDLVLKGTNWKIGSIDPSLELIIGDDGYVDDPDKEIPRRSFEETKITVINLLYKMAQTFGVILQFDTFNRTISVTTPEKAETDKGLFASYGKFVKSLDEDIDSESIVTRLFVYGRDNLTINEVNPTGQSYLEDFSYYMQGYETDSNGNVISSSPYMSDSLCQAIIDYNLLLIEKDGLFKFYLDELKPLQNTWSTKMAEMYQLEYDLEIILDNLDLAKAHEHNLIEQRKQEEAAQRQLIASKQIEIDAIEAQIQDVENDISDLRELLSLENNFTQEQIEERNDYISYGEWTDSNIIKVEELYEKGKEQFKKMREPIKDLDLSLVQFLSAIECHSDWDRIGLGYVIRVDYEPLDIEFRAVITNMKIGFDSNDLSISISNVDYKDDKLKFLEMLYGTAVSTADRLQQKDKEWSDNIDRTDYLAEFLENPWETSRQRILAGQDEVIQIGRRGIIINNPKFPNEQVILQSGIIALSRDYGENWDTAISPYGVAASVVIGKLIMGEKLEIGDEEGTFEIKGNLLTIKDRNDVVRLRLGEYSNNKFGLQLMNKTGSQVVLDENGILQTWQQGAADNVDQVNGLQLNIYLPSDTLSIRQAILRFVILPFRSYSATTKSGGATVPTTSSGGSVQTSTASGGGSTPTSSSGGGVAKSTASGGGSTPTSTAGGNHVHRMFSTVGFSTNDQPDLLVRAGANSSMGSQSLYLPAGNAAPAEYYTAGSSGNHSHTVTIGSHTHSFEIPNHSHTVTIQPHSHNFTIPAHDHTVTIPAHSHDIAHGIYTSTFAQGVGVIINGINRTNQLGGKFNSSQANLNIAPYLNIGQWNTIELTSEQLGRLDGNIFIQAMLAT